MSRVHPPLPGVALLIACSVTSAAPYVPTNDALIIERAVAPADPQTSRLRTALLEDPANRPLAMRLVRRHLALGRAQSDPHQYGRAQAVLEPFVTQPHGDPEALFLRATLRQNRHDFVAALRDLDRVLQARPRLAAAWLTRAVVLSVMGRLDESADSCRRISGTARVLQRTACLAIVDGRRGEPAAAYASLLAALERTPTSTPEVQQWVLDVLAELALHDGQPEAAERHYLDALAVGPADANLRDRYADLLLDQHRAKEVVTLLAADARADGALLRLALAERALGVSNEQHARHVAELQARFEAARLRGDPVHLGAESRYLLALANRPDEALAVALENWAIQREPSDARAVIEAALVVGDQHAAEPVVTWLRANGFASETLRPLLLRLEGLTR